MDYRIRAARPADIPDLAKLQVIAADGMIDAIYHDLIPGRAVHEIVAERFHRPGTTWSYENCWVAEENDRVLGDLHAYPLDDEGKNPPDPLVPAERYAVTAPFDDLDPAAAGSFHMNVVAVFPEFRSRGIGRALLSLAETEAKARGFGRLSLVAFEENASAIRLYERLGFTEVARAAVVPHPLLHHGGNLLMLMKDL